MTKRSTAALLLLFVCGCGTSERAINSDTAEPSSQQAETRATPQIRTFDADAEKELKKAGHTGPEDVLVIAQKYAGIRWRFQAEVMRLDAAEPSQFHTGSITVQPEGLARTYVRLRSQDTKQKLYPGQKHEFEGTFERCILQSGLDALVFNDGILVGL